MVSFFLNTESSALLLKLLTEEQTVSELTEATTSLRHVKVKVQIPKKKFDFEHIT
jgi:hypothetical protein